jgi:hypothetical protein
MNATKAELRKLQEQIAEGRAPVLLNGKPIVPELKRDVVVWHHAIAGFGLRIYRSGAGTWLLQYRNARGVSRRFTIGDAAAINLTAGENQAKILIGNKAGGADPQRERQETRQKPKRTLGAMIKRFLDERKNDLSPTTLYVYACDFKNHVGNLAAIEMDEIRKIDVREMTKRIENEASKHCALRTRSLVSAVYHWASKEGLIDVPNPVRDTYKPTPDETCARSLSLEELGAIWRACESLATSPGCYRGNGNGGPIPVSANSVRAASTLLTVLEAGRQFGLHKSIVWRAIKGDLKALLRGDVPINHPANHPSKIKQGQGHRKDYLIEASEMERFVNSRQDSMRSPLAEYAVIVRLLMLLGCRWAEIGALRRTEIEIDPDGGKGVLHIKGGQRNGAAPRTSATWCCHCRRWRSTSSRVSRTARTATSCSASGRKGYSTTAYSKNVSTPVLPRLMASRSSHGGTTIFATASRLT